jgi:hypothetical protein
MQRGKKNEENPYPRRRCAQRFQESSALLPDSIEKCILTNKSAPELAIAATKKKKRSKKHTQGLCFFGLCLPEYKQERHSEEEYSPPPLERKSTPSKINKKTED